MNSRTDTSAETANMKEFFENNDGVHLMFGEHSLCGDAFDIGSVEGEECGDLLPTRKRTVTCERCAEIITYCRNVRVASRGTL